MYKIIKQQGYIVQHREIQPLFDTHFKWSIIYKNIESHRKTKINLIHFNLLRLNNVSNSSCSRLKDNRMAHFLE